MTKDKDDNPINEFASVRHKGYSNRTEKISFRCTPAQKKKIESKARKCDVTVSEYMMDLAEHDCHPKRNRDKERLAVLVQTEERMNDLMLKYGGLDPNLREDIDKIIKGAEGLWVN